MPLADAWQRFFAKIDSTCAYKAGQVSSLQRLSTDVEEVVRRLNDDDVLSFVQRAEIIVTKNNSDEAMVIGILEREMVHLADKPEPQDTAEADDILEEGEEVKDSLDDLLEWLPNVIKKLLKLLNELMKLIRGGG